MSIRSHLRNLRELAEGEGLVIVLIERRGSGHIGLRVRNAAGREQTTIVSATPGDRRAWLNVRGHLRRFARSATQLHTPAKEQAHG